MTDSKFRDAVGRDVVKLLREERERQGMSMTRLAAEAGLSHAMISLTERSLRKPTLDTLLRVSESLEINLAEVLTKAMGRTRKLARVAHRS